MSFQWIKFEDQMPESGRYIYVPKPDESIDIIFYISPISINAFGPLIRPKKWCYVYIPDPPKKEKLERCEQLYKCSNNYILALEERIEKLESFINGYIKPK